MNLVFKLVAVDGASAAASACWVARLDHEVWDDPMHEHVVVVAAFGESAKVLACLFCYNCLQLGCSGKNEGIARDRLFGVYFLCMVVVKLDNESTLSSHVSVSRFRKNSYFKLLPLLFPVQHQ